ncbi:MAG TPA: adenylosuccinate lyase, partial [Candidatus Paceibacterota bacterium]|nr:adenylosuccinate lyase [Candidatus Paceibacterota bacterium]
MATNELTAISPLDGRYRSKVERLAPYMSEYGLIRYRVGVECAYLMALARERKLPFTLSKAEEDILARIAAVSEADAALVKKIETEGVEGIPATRHDVKAVEYYIKQRIRGTTLEEKAEWVHFALTSEDVNNIAYALMLSDALESVLVPRIVAVQEGLLTLARTYAATPMLARTHGQSASPTTFGKEMKVFSERIATALTSLKNIKIQAKLNGASGNWNAHAIAYPEVDWMAFTSKFIDSLNVERTYKLEANLYTTQIECHDSYVAVFDTVRRINTILIDFSQDMWRYISDSWVTQKPKAGEIGSSAMPHKVNPIDFENAEGNFGMANALFEHFGRKLPISRLQRDLSDSTTERNFGVSFAHSLIGYESLLTGLSRIEPNTGAMAEALAAHPEVLAEAVQTVLRREGQIGAYEKLKDLTR